MQSLSKYNKGIKYLLCAIDLFSKYAWVVPIKDKKGLILLMYLKKNIKIQIVVKQSLKDANQIWVDQGSEFHNNSFKVILKINNIHSS